MRNFLKISLFFAFVLAVVFPGSVRAEQSGEEKISGAFDQLRIEDGKIFAQGWVATLDQTSRVIEIEILIDKKSIYRGRFLRFERPDVVSVTGKKQWLNSGWSIEAKVQRVSFGNLNAAKIIARTDAGEVKEIKLAGDIRSVNSHYEIIPLFAERAFYVVGALLCLASFCSALSRDYVKSFFLKKFGAEPSGILISSLLVGLLFCLLVGFGVTGSSLGLGLKNSPSVVSDYYQIVGAPQGIRSDEWLVFTPLAASQVAHKPAFPVVNKNLGVDGQNMLIVGMAGVPVNHISALVKPATWGLHLFDLRRGLAWYWWFPIFSCFFSIWAVLSLVFPGNSTITFFGALVFSSSPYLAAWSFWPAYVVFFAATLFYAFISLLSVTRLYSAVAFSCLLGFALAGFVLVLYPPWQVSVGYLFAFLALGVVVRDRLYRYLSGYAVGFIAVGVLLAGFILWQWWLDAAPAVALVMDTVYPGGRQAVVGGGLGFVEMIRGFSNIITLHKLGGATTNQSEVASFMYYFPGLAVLFFYAQLKKMLTAVHWFLFVFIAYVVFFMVIGVPSEVSVYSLWGRVPSFRADLSLGLASVFLSTGIFVAMWRRQLIWGSEVYALVSGSVALVWAGLVIIAIINLPDAWLIGFTSGIFFALFIFVGISSYWLSVGQWKKFYFVVLAYSISTVAPFNPLNVAPSYISASPQLLPEGGSVLVANTQVPAMFLLAAGVPVSNGVLYYPQMSMWRSLDPQAVDVNLYNRYQHLFFVLDNVAFPFFRIESPSLDVVRVVIDRREFDFRKTGARFLLAPEVNSHALLANETLAFVRAVNGWVLFSILVGALE